MNHVPTALLVGGDPVAASAVGGIAERAAALRLVLAADLPDAVRLVSTERPAAIVVAPRCMETLAEHLPALLADGPTAPLVIGARPASEMASHRLVHAGVDALVGWPVEDHELGGLFRLAARLGRTAVTVAAQRTELGHLRRIAEQNADETVEMLVSMLDLGVAGALDRGMRSSELAIQLARRLEVPEGLLGDLDRAARLHELGRLAQRTPTPTGAGDGWRVAQSAVAMLRDVKDLAGAVEVIGGIHENWDGTGLPHHDLQGQIPLRCRILRVVLDFTAMVDGPGGQPLDAVLERIEDHAGTHYDPMVVAHLKNLVGGLDERHWRGASVLLPIDELHVGMVLAEDLYTDSGLKLLTSGTMLTSATLQVIQRRHRVEPLEHGAAVLRESAA